MDPERWQRIEEVFRAVIECPVNERDEYLARACGNDEALRREVLSLLARDTADDFFEASIGETALSLTAQAKEDLVGERVGAYRLTRLIGHGGMGSVYEAVRDDDQFQQQVAIKLIKRGMDSQFVRQRFKRERQILAGLDHSFIARLLDGGTTADGVPYFVMEYVAGRPLTEYCRNNNLPVTARLKLFRDVCAAVQHAHQKLVIHRDLKPSNILVTTEGTPKLLDFGIAKLLQPDASEAATRTETAVRLMTPDYASPEQVRGLQITTMTDVYALGVVLYELLTDRRPHEFKTYSPAEIERAICDTTAEEPSKAVSRITGASPKLARQLAGDLDNIVMMAMRKEPERRYQSVEQLSEDVRRHLTGLPVAARKDTFNYRASKFVRRHKFGVAALAALVTLTLALAIAAFRIAGERDRANQAAATAEAVTQSLVSVFDFADPGKSRGNAITAKELLDQGAEKVVRDLQGQPIVQARLMDTIGGLYQSIGVYDRAQPLLEKALQLRQQSLGAEHVDVATSLHHLAELTYRKGDLPESEKLFRMALAMRRKVLGAEHPNLADSLNDLGLVLTDRGNFSEAEALLREALAMRRKLLGMEHTDVANSLNNLGTWMSSTGKYREAEDFYRQALAIRRKLYSSDHPDVARGLNNIASMLQQQGDFKGAADQFSEALAMRRRLFGEEHPDVQLTMVNLASALQDLKEYDEAEQLFRHALTLAQKLYPEAHPRLATTVNNLGVLLEEKGNYQEAETYLRQALAMRRKAFGESHRDVGASLHNLGALMFLKGNYAEAEKMQRQAIETFLKSLKPDHWMVQRSNSELGACLLKFKRYNEAETLLLSAYAGLKAARGEQHKATRKTASTLIELYEAWGKPLQADTYRALPHAKP